MALEVPDPIFMGKTHGGIRKTLKGLLKQTGYKIDKIVVPCAGSFSVEETLVGIGFDPTQIVSNDICIYSSCLGYFFDPKKDVKDLGFKILDQDILQLNLPDATEQELVAKILFTLKSAQIDGKSEFCRWQRLEYHNQWERIFDSYMTALENMKTKLGGLTYRMGDANALIGETMYEKGVFIYYDPPFYKGGYTKMFDPKDYFSWKSPSIPELDPDACQTFVASLAKAPTLIAVLLSNWTNYTSLPSGFEIAYVEVTDPKEGKRVFLLLNQAISKSIAVPRKQMPLPSQVYSLYQDQEITTDSVLGVVPITRELSLYYYDLLVRELGFTDAEVFFAIVIDGRVLGTAGFMVGSWVRDRKPEIFENFGITVLSNKYPKLGKLLMSAITCREFVNRVEASYEDKLRPKIVRIRTACLSKYESSMSHRGIFLLKDRKKLKNGRYHLMYETKVFEKTYAEVLQGWLKKTKQESKNQTQKKVGTESQ